MLALKVVIHDKRVTTPVCSWQLLAVFGVVCVQRFARTKSVHQRLKTLRVSFRNKKNTVSHPNFFKATKWLVALPEAQQRPHGP